MSQQNAICHMPNNYLEHSVITQEKSSLLLVIMIQH